MRNLLMAAAAGAALATVPVLAGAEGPAARATVEGQLVSNTGARIGDVRLREAGPGLIIHIHATGLPPGPHGMHLHENSDCSDVEQFESAGDHVAQEGQMHGFLSDAGAHSGDLPNLIVGDDGVVNAEFETIRLPLHGAHGALLDQNGAALVIHANEDDYADPEGGGSGDRIACAALERPTEEPAPAE